MEQPVTAIYSVACDYNFAPVAAGRDIEMKVCIHNIF